MSVFVNATLMKKVIRSNGGKRPPQPTRHWMSNLAKTNSWSIKRVDIDSACPGKDCAHRAVMHLQSGAIVEAPATKDYELVALLKMLQVKLPDDGERHFTATSSSSEEEEMVRRLDQMFVKIAISLSKPKKKKRTETLGRSALPKKGSKSPNKEKEPRVVRKHKNVN